MDVDDLVIVCLLGLGAWWALSLWRSRHPADKQILNAQAALEKHLREYWLPDHPGGKDAYIYKQLMRGWYEQIVAQSRYDKNRLRAIRVDWMEYIDLVQRNATNGFLHVTSKTPFEGRAYNNMLHGSSRAEAIENAFAALIGNHATLLLNTVREKAFDDFDHEGDTMKS